MKINEDKVPTNLDEAVAEIVAALSPEDIEYIKKQPPESVHFTIGMYLRNNYSLWDKDTILVQWFIKNLKICHGDDLSAIILDGVPRKTEELVKRFREHWLKCGVNAITGEEL